MDTYFIIKLETAVKSIEVEVCMHKVYIKVNETHEITDVNSDVFIEKEDIPNWVKIDEGNGDKYVHAQGNYFEKPLRNEEEQYNYLYINGKVYER